MRPDNHRQRFARFRRGLWNIYVEQGFFVARLVLLIGNNGDGYGCGVFLECGKRLPVTFRKCIANKEGARPGTQLKSQERNEHYSCYDTYGPQKRFATIKRTVWLGRFWFCGSFGGIFCAHMAI